MQTRSSDENSVYLSVRHTRALWQNGIKIRTDVYTVRKNIYPSFLRRRMVGGGRPLLGEILGQRVRVLCCSLCFSAQFFVHFFRNGGDRGLRVRVIILLRQYGFDVCLFVCLWRVDCLFVTSWPCDESTGWRVDRVTSWPVTSWLCDELTVWRVSCHPSLAPSYLICLLSFNRDT